MTGQPGNEQQIHTYVCTNPCNRIVHSSLQIESKKKNLTEKHMTFIVFRGTSEQISVWEYKH